MQSTRVLATSTALACGIGFTLLTAPVAHATELTSPDSTPAASTHAMVIDDAEPPAADDGTEPTEEPEPPIEPEPTGEPEPELPQPEMPVVPVAPAVPDAPAPDFAESELEYDTDSVSTSSDFSDESEDSTEESAPTKLAVTGPESSGATVTALGLAALAAGLGALGIRRRFRRA
ncbi:MULTISPECIES: LPXTG cell wall anchor domain-containing protein [unclassified Pseudoclavibacter]|uniref:LPXTG cell wall anchor domain-containing protein n=1 Tax=unclassified Pseudoclavibacter TaxID=2615177 RepID=UPI001BAAF57F|nr:LPXTG cell wall anchor domain-containing protein [Pseudoclavibacter sp. Marseille-Q4354]MBS3177246.1 LPXTG cell wall anchor domain-containing protein [Pseudoclavibacter sp. Marseille-Q4354]